MLEGAHAKVARTMEQVTCCAGHELTQQPRAATITLWQSRLPCELYSLWGAQYALANCCAVTNSMTAACDCACACVTSTVVRVAMLTA